jgi:hypothetical protein
MKMGYFDLWMHRLDEPHLWTSDKEKRFKVLSEQRHAILERGPEQSSNKLHQWVLEGLAKGLDMLREQDKGATKEFR